MSDMWWHSYRTPPEDFTLMTLKCRVEIPGDLVLDSSNKSGIVVVVTTSLSSHCQVGSLSFTCEILCGSAKPTHLEGFCGEAEVPWRAAHQHCLSSPPPPPKPAREMTLMRLGPVCVYLTNSSSSALVLTHQVNPPKGSLDVPVKEDHIHSAAKIQAKHWGKPGLSLPGRCAVPQPAAPCALPRESFPCWIFRQIYAHLCIHI